jgi:hypothetical protein
MRELHLLVVLTPDPARNQQIKTKFNSRLRPLATASQGQTARTEIRSKKTSVTPCSNSGAALSLLAQMFQSLAHRCARNFDHAVQGMVHLQDNKNRP